MKYSYQEYGVFIGGEFIPSVKKETEEINNPANGKVLARVYRGSLEDVDVAVQAARKAFKSWKKTSPLERSNILLKIKMVIEDNLEYLAYIETLDSGKPIIETREDIKAIADQFAYFSALLRAEEDSFTRFDQDNMAFVMREPYGVVAQIIPWNFPFLLGGWKIAPALAAGNTIIMKPADLTPLSILELAKLTKDIIPAGVFNIVTGAGSVVGQSMVEHRDVNKVAFTGSTGVGMNIAKTASQNVIPVSLELGGKSANIIFPDAPMEKAVEGAVLGILYGQGQVCNAGSRVFIHESIYEETLEKIIEIFKKVKIGLPENEETRMATLISEKQMNSVLNYIQIGLDEGAKLAYGGHRLNKEPFDKGYFVEPTIFRDVDNKMRIAQEEIFGPVLCVIPFKDEEDVIEMANDSDFGLAGACWTKDINKALRVAMAIDTGLFWINEYHLAPSGTPFGGYKKTGYGRENHKSALESYSQLKTVYVSLSENYTAYYD